MTDKPPRVWTGEWTDASIWYWLELKWVMAHTIDNSDIFAPGNQPKPVYGPAEMSTIATCDEVDWI